jgi:hypothetical protein
MLHHLEHTHSLLLRLAESLRVDLEVLRGAIVPASRAHGISALPAEILGAIFEEVVRGCKFEGLNKASMSLAHVCRRFRDIALGTPSLWIHFSWNDVSTFVRFKLGLLKDAPIHASLLFGLQFNRKSWSWEETERGYRSFDILYELRMQDKLQRLRTLEVITNTYLTSTDYNLQDLTFPSLHSLMLMHGSFYGVVETASPGFPRWDLPSLRHLTTNCLTIPTALPNLTSLTIGTEWDLRTCDLDAPPTTCNTGSLSDFFEALASCHSLERLAIILEHMDFEKIYSVGQTEPRPIELPSLQELKMVVWDGIVRQLVVRCLRDGRSHLGKPGDAVSTTP